MALIKVLFKRVFTRVYCFGRCILGVHVVGFVVKMHECRSSGRAREMITNSNMGSARAKDTRAAG